MKTLPLAFGRIAVDRSNSFLARRRRGRVLLKIVIPLVICSAVGFLFLRMYGPSDERGVDADSGQFLVHMVERSEFVSIITESGDIESASNVEVRCDVKSEGGGGMTILEIVDEGTIVSKGDFLAQLDDSALRLNLTQQEILVATDQAAVIDAQSELDKATHTLTEYKNGLFLVDRETFESELFQAESQLKSVEDLLEHERRMFRKGYVSQLQLEAQEMGVEMARKAAQAAKTRLMVHNDFTRQKMISEYEADIEKQKANLTAAQYTLKLSEQRRDELMGQVEQCRMVAPVDGQVVYANDYKSYTRTVIEEGAQVRQGQVVFRLPDPKQMQVDMRISDSKVNLLSVGCEAEIELDVDPNLRIRGVLAEISPFPYPREWKGAPIEYGAIVRVTEMHPSLRPGQRGKVHMYVERKADVLQSPIQSVVGRGDGHYCLVKDDQGKWDVRQVVVGPSNDSYVVVEDGLNAGDQVALNPDLLWQDVVGELPEAVAKSVPAEEETTPAKAKSLPTKGKSAPAKAKNVAAAGG